MTITNSTLLSGTYGGTIYNDDTLHITASTFSGNYDGYDRGVIYNHTGTVTIGGSIIASSTGGNCRGTITDNGYNLEWSGADHTGTCSFGRTGKHDRTGTNPQLGSLASHGGPTQTIALASTSPAIDQIPTSSGLCPTTDQRGIARPDDGEAACDIGAYEFGGTDGARTTTPTKPATTKPTPVPTTGSSPLTFPVEAVKVGYRSSKPTSLFGKKSLSTVQTGHQSKLVLFANLSGIEGTEGSTTVLFKRVNAAFTSANNGQNLSLWQSFTPSAKGSYVFTGTLFVGGAPSA